MSDFTQYSDRYPPRNRPSNELGILDIEIQDAMGKLTLDPNRMAVAGHLEELPVLESEATPSELSGAPGVRMRTSEIDLVLSKAELFRMHQRNLRPEEVRALIEKYGVFHEVHDDFYDEDTFEALQPR